MLGIRKLGKRNKYKVIYIIILVIIFSVYAYFNWYSSKNLLSMDQKYSYFRFGKQNVYGFYTEEKLENGLEYCWSLDKALKRVKISGSKIIIPVFCVKPDIEKEAINVRIFFNDKFVQGFCLEDHRIRYLRYNVCDMGYKRGEYLDVKFEVDELWCPADYANGEDTRRLGIAVGKIKFLD